MSFNLTVNGISIPKKAQMSLELFLLLKFEIIEMRIDQIIRIMKSFFLKLPTRIY